MRRVLLILALTATAALAEAESTPASPPVTGTPTLDVACARGGLQVRTAGRGRWEQGFAKGSLRPGEGVRTSPAGHAGLRLSSAWALEGEELWIFLGTDTELVLRDLRPPGGEGPPALFLDLEKGQALVCRHGEARPGPGWTTVVTTLGGSVRVEDGSALVRAGQLLGHSRVTALRGTVATTRWRDAFGETRVVPEGFQRGVGKMGPRAGEPILWRVDPVEFLRPFPQLGSCGPTGEACRGPWKRREKPRGWWR
jgi:hypothetical protein